MAGRRCGESSAAAPIGRPATQRDDAKELSLLRSELSRLSERYPWLRHAYVEVESQHPANRKKGEPLWPLHHEGLQQAMFESLGDFRCDGPRVLEWWPRSGLGQWYSVLFANRHCSNEVGDDAVRYFRTIAAVVSQHISFRSRHWKGSDELGHGMPSCIGRVSEVRDGVVMRRSGTFTDAKRRLLEHLDAVFQPERQIVSCRADAENLVDFGIYELHTDPFAAALACLDEGKQKRTADRKADGNTRRSKGGRVGRERTDKQRKVDATTLSKWRRFESEHGGTFKDFCDKTGRNYDTARKQRDRALADETVLES